MMVTRWATPQSARCGGGCLDVDGGSGVGGAQTGGIDVERPVEAEWAEIVSAERLYIALGF